MAASHHRGLRLLPLQQGFPYHPHHCLIFITALSTIWNYLFTINSESRDFACLVHCYHPSSKNDAWHRVDVYNIFWMNEQDLICVHQIFRHFDGIWGLSELHLIWMRTSGGPIEARCTVSREGRKKQEEWRNVPHHHFQIPKDKIL